MLCPNCKKEIAEGAQFCPECGASFGAPVQNFAAQQPTQPVKQKKPITKKWWFWVIIVVVVIALFSAVGGGGDTPDTPVDSGNVAQEDAQTTKGAEKTTASRKTNFVVGETVNDGKLAITYVAAEEWSDYNYYSSPESGKKIIRLKFDFVNNGETDAYITSFDCYADNVIAENYYGGEDTISAFTISAGRTTSGWVYFEVPENASSIEVEYEVNVRSDEKAIFVVDLK